MTLLAELIHPDLDSRQGIAFRRHAARGIVLRIIAIYRTL